MSNSKNERLDQTIELLKKVAQDPNSVSNAEKKKLKKLIGGDTSLMIEAMQTIQKEIDPDYYSNTPHPSPYEDNRTEEEIIADNYVTLAKFAIEKLHIQNVQKIKVQDTDCGFIFYALTPDPVELDFEQFATSDYPNNKELLLEAEALQADLFMEDSTEAYKAKIIQLIENSVL